MQSYISVRFFHLKKNKIEETIKLSELQKDVNEGMKRKELSLKYTDGNNNALTKLLKSANLTIRKFQTPKYVLENDLEKTVETTTFVGEKIEVEA